MSTAIEDAIAAAKASAAQAPQLANDALSGGVSLPSTQNTSTAVAQRGAPLGIDDMLSGSLNVVAWLKVNHFGMQVGSNPTLFTEPFDVILDMSEITYNYSVRYGNPAQYEKTYDRVTNSKGGSWVETLQRAQRIDPKASEYRSADIPIYMVNDVKAKDGTVLVNAGEAVGHSLAVTGWKNFQDFIRVLIKAGIDPKTGRVALKLGHLPRKNDAGAWGVLTFTDPVVVQ